MGVAGVLLRAVDLPARVLPGGGVVIPAFDPYYHLHRILQTVQHWPRVPLFDPGMNFPDGAMIIWPPLFDWSLATAARMAGCGDQTGCVEAVTSALIPLIGVATMVPLYLLARGLFGNGVALLASLLLVLSPIHIWYSRFGFVDHHTAVTFLSVVLMWVVSRAVRPGSSMWWRAAVALVLAAGLLSWNGFLFYVAVVDSYFLILLVQERPSPTDSTGSLVMVSHFGAILLVAPVAYATVAAGGKPFFALTLSWFHVAAVAAFGLVGLIAFVFKQPSFRRLTSLERVSVVALLSGVVVLLLGSQRHSIAEGLTWMTTSDSFMSEVNESFPLFIEQGRFDITAPIRALTALFYLLPIGLVLMWRRVFGDRGRDRTMLLVAVWGTALLLMTLLQRRFAEPLAPVQALILAWLLIELAKKLFGVTRVGWIAAGAAIALLVTATHVGGVAALLAGDPAIAAERDVAEFLARARHRIGAAASGSDGVLSPWRLGHRIQYLTGQPVVTNNFGSYIGRESYLDGHRFFLASDEAEGVAILRRRHVRYVVSSFDLPSAGSAVRALGLDQFAYFARSRSDRGEESINLLPPAMRTLFFRLAILEGSERTFHNDRGGELRIAGLGRFRLLADARVDGKPDHPKLFELVPGATLEVRADPGETVWIRYRFTSDTARAHLYERSAVASERGVASFVVGYPSDWPELGFSSRYEIEVSGVLFHVAVPETAIAAGATVVAELPGATDTAP